MSDFQRVKPSAKVVEGTITVGFVGVKKIGLTRIGGAVHAFNNLCPHAASPLSAGTLAGCIVTCSRHGWRFDVTSGRSLDNDLYDLTTHETREVDGWVEVRVADVIW